MRTRNSQQFYDKINEQKKWWNVEVEYEVEVSIHPQTLRVGLEGGYEDFGEDTISFSSVKTTFKGAKYFEVEATSEEEARKRFEDLKDVSKWDIDFYIEEEYISDGFEGEIESVEIRVISVEEIEP